MNENENSRFGRPLRVPARLADDESTHVQLREVKKSRQYGTAELYGLLLDLYSNVGRTARF